MRNVALFFVSLAALVAAACSSLVPILSTPTPIPTPDHSILAADKRMETAAPDFVVYSVPGMELVTVANIPYNDSLTMDVYYPPDFDFAQALPVVVFVNGFDDRRLKADVGTILKDAGIYISWGQLVAASGMLGITYEAEHPDTDIHDVLRHVRANASHFRAIPDRICLWSSSANSALAVRVITDATLDYRDSLVCAVIYFGVIRRHGDLSPSIPLLVAKAGLDDERLNRDLDRFVQEAREANIPLEYLVYDDGRHGFDGRQDTEESRNIIEQTLEFLRSHLFAQ